MPRRLAEAGQAWDRDGLTYWLNELRERGLVFTERGRWVSLATTSTSTSTTAAAVSEPLAALAAAGA